MQASERLNEDSPSEGVRGLDAELGVGEDLSRLAGPLAGIVGLLVFLVLHHVWIVPIWFILPIGVPIAVGGAAVAWAYRELFPSLPRRPWAGLALVLLISVILLPALVLAELRSPMFDLSGPGGAVLLMSPGRAAVVFVIELLLTSAALGALAGWVIARTRRAVYATALAGVVFAAGPGHNIPFGGGTPAVGLEILIMLAVIVPTAFVLVEGHRLLTSGRFSRNPGF